MRLKVSEELYDEQWEVTEKDGYTYVKHDHDCYHKGWTVAYKWTKEGILFRLDCAEHCYHKFIEVEK